MIPKSCKRLAEVDFPIAEVSKHSLIESPGRKGHPWGLHKWWARRPLASTRAILLSLLLPDPCDPECPESFKENVRKLLPRVQGSVGKSDKEIRRALLKFIGNFASWDLSTNRDYLDIGRNLVKIANANETPLIVDPFAGGGSIPLESLRLGCDVYSSDLNPVAAFINKVILEDIPRGGAQLVDKFRYVGNEIKEKAEIEMEEFYPIDPDGAKPIVYLWSRTIKCESPNCGAEIPITRSFWLSKKSNRKYALRYKVNRSGNKIPDIEFEIFKPKSENDVPVGTVTRGKVTCIACNSVHLPQRVRAQLYSQRGGSDVIFDKNGSRIGGTRILAVVVLKNKEIGRSYRLPSKIDYDAIYKSRSQINKIINNWERSDNQALSPVPNEPLPPIGTLGFRVQRYGMLNWGDLFNVRQKLLLYTLYQYCHQIEDKTVKNLMALAIDKIVMYSSTSCRWKASGESLVDMFGRNALPIVWDFAESVPLAGSAGGFLSTIESISNVLTNVYNSVGNKVGQVSISDACDIPLPDESTNIWFTDPPYYDAIPYSDLSDCFLVWLQRALPDLDLLRNPYEESNLSPKIAEIVQDNAKTLSDGTIKDKQFFEKKISIAFSEGKRILTENGIGSVVFAHKTTEGWEALLSGMIQSGWTITGSWPIATEMGSRLRARDSAALATSVHLVCRPRPADAVVGDWSKVLRELPKRVGSWMEHLQNEGVHGADLVFACIGPALEIYSRYSKVETAEGEEVKLPVYLEKVWEVVGRIALENILGTDEAKARNGVAGALEEDARLTALFLWTLQSTKMGGKSNGNEGEQQTDAEDEDEEVPASKKGKSYSLVFDVVRRFAQPLGINLPKWEKRIIETQKGTVRLLPITERAKILFGKDGAQTVAAQLEMSPTIDTLQQSLFPEYEVERPKKSKRKGRKKTTVDVSGDSFDAQPEATTLDRLHAAMILQASGRTNALRTFLKEEIDRNPDFLRLANALSALYPRGSEEKRLLDAMLLAVRK